MPLTRIITSDTFVLISKKMVLQLPAPARTIQSYFLQRFSEKRRIKPNACTSAAAADTNCTRIVQRGQL
jgi:hypothetical protein